jgi:hypothetical protein
MSLSGSFQYVLIPADASQPIKICSADKSGGLENDLLVKHAKNFFHDLTGSRARAQKMEEAGPEERKALADQIRLQLDSSPDLTDRLKNMDDKSVLDMVYKSQAQPSCDIMALTVPCAGNNFKAVSMYSADSAKQHGLPQNGRATALMTACGHAAVDGGVYGDAFVGRALDNENTDVWARIDFLPADADPGADWCRAARGQGGGGGSGTKAASSLSNLVTQQQFAMQGNGNKVQAIDGMPGSETNSLFGLNGAPPVQETWGTWTQTDTEVELKFPVSSGTKSKYCKLNFGRLRLKVTVAGQVLLQGAVFDPIPPDECTFTLQDEGIGRELCVTLYKTEPRTWSYIVK